MTIKEFNAKWQRYRTEGAYGLDIDDPNVIDYLDKEFLQESERNARFYYSQIKVKCGTSRIYTNSLQKMKWEETIDKIMMNPPKKD